MDGHYTVSAFSRFTYGWTAKVLKAARTFKTFDITMIPKLHLRIRSIYLESRLSSRSKANQHLLKTLVRAHASALIFQTFFSTGSSILQFAPQLVMYTLLKLLEQREELPEFARAAWTMVILLGLALLATAWSESWTHWMYVTRLGLPVRSELGAMIFSKAMRRKDSKGAELRNRQNGGQKTLSDSDGTSLPTQVNVGNPPNAVEEDVQKSRQATINLVVSRSSMPKMSRPTLI